MRNITFSVNESEYKCLRSLCERIGESDYKFAKQATFERMARYGSTIAKIQEWLLTDHPIVKRKTT